MDGAREALHGRRAGGPRRAVGVRKAVGPRGLSGCGTGRCQSRSIMRRGSKAGSERRRWPSPGRCGRCRARRRRETGPGPSVGDESAHGGDDDRGVLPPVLSYPRAVGRVDGADGHGHDAGHRRRPGWSGKPGGEQRATACLGRAGGRWRAGGRDAGGATRRTRRCRRGPWPPNQPKSFWVPWPKKSPPSSSRATRTKSSMVPAYPVEPSSASRGRSVSPAPVSGTLAALSSPSRAQRSCSRAAMRAAADCGRGGRRRPRLSA